MTDVGFLLCYDGDGMNLMPKHVHMAPGTTKPAEGSAGFQC